MFIDSREQQLRTENEGQLAQFSQRSSIANINEAKVLTETTNENNQNVTSPLKKTKTFGFQEVSSELSEASFQMRKRTESHNSHFSPGLIRNSLKIEVQKQLYFYN